MNTHKPRTKQEAHEEALESDLNEQYTIGDQLDLVVLQSPCDNNGREAIARYNDVVVFIYPGGHNLYVGNRIRAKVSEIGESHLKAVCLADLE